MYHVCLWARSILVGTLLLTLAVVHTSCGAQPAGSVPANSTPADPVPASSTSIDPEPASPASNASEPASASTPVNGDTGVPDQVRSLVQQLGQYYAGLQRFEGTVSVRSDDVSGGPSKMPDVAYVLTGSRPNLLKLELRIGAESLHVLCDGKNVFSYIPALKQYVASQAPGDMGDVLWTSEVNTKDLPLQYLNALLQKAPSDILLSGVRTAEYVGIEDLAGVKCHHLKLERDDYDWEAWVDSGKVPILRRIGLDFSRPAAKSPSQATAGPKKLLLTFDPWHSEPELSGDTFVFAPASDAAKVDTFRPPDESEGPETLLGKPAPAFTAGLLDGGTLDLAAHRGKNIVILDFWAIRCPPCRAMLPILQRVAGEYKAKDVVFYTVNREDTPDAIRAFLQSLELTLTVALNPNADVGRLYKVNYIPQTVIIGKDGTIQAVHVGMIPNGEQQLRKELDTLIAGGKLTPGT